MSSHIIPAKLFLIIGILIQCTSFCQRMDYPWLHRERNFIQYGSSHWLARFASAWKNADQEALVVLHLGDSHLQNENLPSHARFLAQREHGDAGLGLIMPYSTVNTYNASIYKSSHTGKWLYSKSYMVPPKLTLGVRGMTAHTFDDSASFQITFNENPSSSNQILSLFCSNADSSYVPDVKVDGVSLELISVNGDIREYNVPNRFLTISVSLKKTSLKQRSFTLYGMSLKGKLDSGCIWHNAGVGACQYKSVLYEEKFSVQASYLNPDVVIIDFGTNDFIYENAISADLKKEIMAVLEKVRQACPEASIILTSAQDMLYKGKRIPAGRLFEHLIREIASEQECGFWNWYDISGGYKTMPLWQENELAKKDGIHLTSEGSKLKAALLYEAMQKTIFHLSEKETNDTLWFEVGPLANQSMVNEVVKEDEKGHAKFSTIKVKKGDTLINLSKKYGVSVKSIKDINKMTSDVLILGQNLKIPKN